MIKSLTSLRGIFILFIFFHHCLSLYPGGGSMAVTFFFMLGGFAMTLGYKGKIVSKDFDSNSISPVVASSSILCICCAYWP